LPKGFDRKGDITELVQNIDYAPTFLELAGAPVPEDIQGVSLLPLLKGEKPLIGANHCIIIFMNIRQNIW
jgi:Sulfatase.